MPAPIRTVDEHGFPIPAKFEPLPGGGDEPRPPKRSIFQRLGRWRWLILFLALPVLFGRQIVDFGRELVANIQLQRAQRDFIADNPQKALDHANRAVAWEPDSVRRAKALSLRAEIQESLQNLDASMTDCNAAIAILNEAKPPQAVAEELADTYRLRAWLHERLTEHREALADCKAALECCPAGDPFLHSKLLNTRAYICALSNMELQTGMQDIEQALREFGQNEPEFVDTRGYLRFRLAQYDAALGDMQNAIRLMEQRRLDYQIGWDPDLVHLRPEDRNEARREIKVVDEGLGVMYHHRGEIYQKLAEDAKLTDKQRTDYQAKAKADMQRATRLKYDPKNGVF